MLLGYNKSYFLSAYRFGFNGMERDDEIFGVTGSSYTAEFWQYDSRIGRRWNLDPKPQISISDYATFGNNPIYMVDPNGDEFDPASQKDVDKHKDVTVDKKNNVDNKISEIQALAEITGNRGLENKLNSLIEENNVYSEALDNISTLEKSDQLYTLNKKSASNNIGGSTYMKNGVVMLDYSDESVLAHEIVHAFQYNEGKLSFDKQTGSAGFLHDATDEVEAHYRQSFYNNDLRLRNVTAEDVVKNSQYSHLKLIPLDVNSTMKDVFDKYKGENAMNMQIWFDDLSIQKQNSKFGSNMRSKDYYR